jgi:hypothetical protein
MIGAAALVLGAVIVAFFLPARSHDHEDVAFAGLDAAGGESLDRGRVVDREPATSHHGDVPAPGEHVRTQPADARVGAEER